MSTSNSKEELIEGVLRHGPDILTHCQTSADIQQYLDRLLAEHLHYPIPPESIDASCWFILEEYQTMDIID